MSETFRFTSAATSEELAAHVEKVLPGATNIRVELLNLGFKVIYEGNTSFEDTMSLGEKFSPKATVRHTDKKIGKNKYQWIAFVLFY